jgi:hypothetical protein
VAASAVLPVPEHVAAIEATLAVGDTVILAELTAMTARLVCKSLSNDSSQGAARRLSTCRDPAFEGLFS